MSAVKTYDPKTSADEMLNRRRAWLVACESSVTEIDLTAICPCGNRCPRCGSARHASLGACTEGRRLRCFTCSMEFVGADTYHVYGRAGDEKYGVGRQGGEIRCTCEGGRYRVECWHQRCLQRRLGRVDRELRGVRDLANLVQSDGPARASRKRVDGRYPAVAGELA